MSQPRVHAVPRRTKEPDAQTFRLQHHILQFFICFLAVFKRFTFLLWDLFLRPLAPTAGRFPDAPGLPAQPLPQHKDAGDVSITSLPQDCEKVDGSTVSPEFAPVQVESEPAQAESASVRAESEKREVVEIIDSEDEEKKEVIVKEVIVIDGSDDEDVETSSSDQTSGELDNQGSEEEGRDEPVQEGVVVQEQQSPPANDSSIDEEQDAESPGSIASNLSGDTLVEPDIPRPKFRDECPQLKRKSDAPAPQPRPELPDDRRYIACGYTFVDDFGWVKETPRQRRSDALSQKMVQRLSNADNASGVVYILRHKHYENLYKVGSTKRSIKARVADSGPCVRGMTEEAGKIGKVWGFRRVEALAHRDMASRNVNMQLCMPCFTKASGAGDDGKNRKRKTQTGKKNGDEDEQKETSHTEWFKGDLEDITKCVEYWAEVVKASYNYEGKFVGTPSEIMDRGLSSQRRKLETPEDSEELRDRLSASPSRCPRSADAVGSQPGTGTHAAREDGEEEGEGAEVGDESGEGEGEKGEDGNLGEVRSRHGGVIWQKADSSDDRPFPKLQDGAVRRGSRKRMSTGAEGVAQPAEEQHPGPGAERRRPKLRRSTGADVAQSADGLRPGTEAKRRSPRLRKSAGAEVDHPAGGLRPGTAVEHAVQCRA